MMLVEDIQELHKEAMDLAEMSFVAKLKGDLENAENLLREAYKKESDSAKLLVDEYDFEPTRSILFRSAASLAIECNDIRGAERLVAFGLSGNPPEEIAEELRDLLEKVNSKRHFDVQVAHVTDKTVGDVTVPNKKPSTKLITIKGILKFADAAKSKIKLVDEDGKPHTIIVPEGMLNDIVRPKWEDMITVTGFVKGREIHLVDID
jgi:hypothetical protein